MRISALGGRRGLRTRLGSRLHLSLVRSHRKRRLSSGGLWCWRRFFRLATSAGDSALVAELPAAAQLSVFLSGPNCERKLLDPGCQGQPLLGKEINQQCLELRMRRCRICHGP